LSSNQGRTNAILAHDELIPFQGDLYDRLLVSIRIIACLVYKNAEKKGMNGLLWGIAGLDAIGRHSYLNNVSGSLRKRVYIQYTGL
jgi:hypothetical protein